MEGLIWFVLGFFTDLLRSVFIPASTDWINRHIPTAKRKKNVEENLIYLDIRGKLKSLGLDPNLARHAQDDVEHFAKLLENKRDAFIDGAVEAIDARHKTQLDLNLEADLRADIARKNMESALGALQSSGWLHDAQAAALGESQAHWEKYAQAQARFAAAEYEGGTMAPLAYSSELEAVTLERTAELRMIYNGMHERHAELIDVVMGR